MNETEIAQRLQASIPADSVYTPPPVSNPEEPISPNEARDQSAYELDEVVQYKLHDLFGAQYNAKDETTRQQLSYIYEQIANMLPEKEYGFIAAKINEMQRIIGIAHSDDRIYRMYQWLRLNNVRRNLDAEMSSLTNG